MDTRGRKVFLDFNDSTKIHVNVDNSKTDSSSNIQRAERLAKLQKILKRNSKLRSTGTMTKIHYPDSLLSSSSAANVKFNKRKTETKPECCTLGVPRRPTRRVTKENVLKFFEMKAICSRPTVAIKTTGKLDIPLLTQPINLVVYKKPSQEAPSLEKAVEGIVNWRKESKSFFKDEEYERKPGAYVPPMLRSSKPKGIVIETKSIDKESFKPLDSSSPIATLQHPEMKKSSEKKMKTNPTNTAALVRKNYDSRNKVTARPMGLQHSYYKRHSKSPPTTQAQDRLLTVQKSISDDECKSRGSESKTKKVVRNLGDCLEKLQIAEKTLRCREEDTKKTNFLCDRIRFATHEECPKPVPLRRPYTKPQ
ncbi:PREDICTED: uncharacterized protein LOC108559671 [Nicrophorus vespilloides]|uniref:Uncharacterized protein LOC108559671 n=1 Tax=Nicrophorus vespilloides TaxID=110193 RepID=A0ABM1MD61_NICVS|nr:PREDICTED: uncharacterized protein LOC108559671 [Nicrophorus vespilloides]